MVRHRFLRDVKYGRGLWLDDNTSVYNYYDLLGALKGMSNSDFKKFVSKKKSLLTDWLISEVEDFVLASRLRKASTRKEYVSVLSERIKELEEASQEISSLLEKKKILREKKNKIFPYIWFAVYGILIVVLFLQHTHYESKTSSLYRDASYFYEEFMIANKQLFSLQNDLLETRARNEQLYYHNKEMADRNKALLEQISILASNPSLVPVSRIQEGEINLTNESVVILVNNPFLARFSDTGSMLPLISHESKAIQVIPANYSEIMPGDIISFENIMGETIIHRVIETGFDEQGWYAVTRGDNTYKDDPEVVRFPQVRRVLVAIIY